MRDLSNDTRGVLYSLLMILVTVLVVVAIADLTDKRPTFTEQAATACAPSIPVKVDAKAQTFECGR